MAVRFDAVGDELNRTANISSNTAFTYMMWTVLDSDQGTSTYQPYLFGLSADLTQGYSCGLLSDVFRIEVYEGGVAVRNGVASGRPALGTPACVFLRCTGTGAGLLTGGYRIPSASTFTTASATLGSLSAVTQVFYAGLFSAFYQNGRKWNVKVWDRALSDAELLVESQYERVMYPSSLNLYWPLPNSGDTADRSGNGRNPTIVGTLTTGDTVANLWRPSRKIFLPLASAVSHATSGDLVGPGSSVVGSAARTRAHPTSGDLTGPGSSIVGSARHNEPHPSSGDLVGPGSVISGSAARTHVHPSSGDLVGPGSTVAGSAARTRVHPSSGDLSGPGSEISGSAARTRVHPSSGDLVGPGAEIVGDADHQGAAGTHDATGALVGQGSTVAGAAARFRAFSTSGVLTGLGSVITGSAARVGAAVTHDSSGDLVGPGAIVDGQARNGAEDPQVGVFWPPFWRYRNKELEEELEKLSPEVKEVIIEAAEKAVNDEPVEIRAELKREKIRYRNQYKEIYLQIVEEMRQSEEDEEIAAIIAFL